MLQSTKGNKGSCTLLSCAKGLPLETIHTWRTIDAMLSDGVPRLKDNLSE